MVPTVIEEIILDYVDQLKEYTGHKAVLREIRERYRKEIVEATWKRPAPPFSWERPAQFQDDLRRFEVAFYQYVGRTSNEISWRYETNVGVRDRNNWKGLKSLCSRPTLSTCIRGRHETKNFAQSNIQPKEKLSEST